jgi:DNA-directed RNA polymerase specialized sigma24 family protein
MLPVFRLVRYPFLNHLISMSVITETQFTLFDRPSSRDGHQAPRHRRRAQLPDLVRDVGQLENNDLVDLIRAAIGEARRRGIGPASEAGGGSRTMPPVTERKSPAAARIVRTTALVDIPPAKASMVRAAVKAGFSPARVAKDFGVSTATVRKLMAP